MCGGINAYTGKLQDSTELISMSSLPVASFSEGDCLTAIKPAPQVRIQPVQDSQGRCFTLKGQTVAQSLQPRGPQVYVLEPKKTKDLRLKH